MEGLTVVRFSNEKFVYISVSRDTEKSLSWEELQKIKDEFYRDLDFIEVYPKHDEIINKANVRHLIHIKGWECPKLSDLETEGKVYINTYTIK